MKKQTKKDREHELSMIVVVAFILGANYSLGLRAFGKWWWVLIIPIGFLLGWLLKWSNRFA